MSSQTKSKGGSPTPASRGQRIAAAGTIVSAIMATSCCWVPLLLLVLGFMGVATAGMASTLRAGLETYRPAFMVATFVFLGVAFYFTYRPRPAASAAAEDC